MRFLLSLCSCLILAACGSNDEVVTTTPDFIEKPTGNHASTSVAVPSVVGSDIPAATQAALEQEIGDRVFFDTNSSVLDQQDIGVLRHQAQWLMAHTGLSVIIQGHADERGTREYNLALGERRAQAVKNYLISAGVSPRRISTISYGKERPEFLGSNQRSWGLNRRSVTAVR